MLLALESKNKLKFIDGSLPKSDSSDNLFEAWKRCNTYVIAWINLSLSANISQSVIWNHIASDLWIDLKHRYYQGDKFRVAELYEELYTLRQGDMDVTSYFTKLRLIWEEIDDFRSIPSCACEVECSCGLGTVRKYRIEDQVTKFLRGLNKQYAGVRSQIMLMEPLPNINIVFSYSRRRVAGEPRRQREDGDETAAAPPTNSETAATTPVEREIVAVAHGERARRHHSCGSSQQWQPE
ncbi:uncharacterized protein [Arachis hypogaea]|uniref:uncharacterized protein n=1 Tax=Arachis hypogaea TaxID=3818 RepID=UPI003B2211BD